MDTINVNAKDGPMGTLKSMLCDFRGMPTHIIVQHAKPWGREEIVVPIEEVEHIEEDHIQLTLSKRGLSFLLAFWSL